MPDLEDLAPDALAALASATARLQHDLGKYVAFQLRWLGPDAGAEERLSALRADLLATRRGPEGAVDAVAVWEAVRRALTGAEPLDNGVTVDLSDDPGFGDLDRAMQDVARVVEALRAGRADADLVSQGERAAFAAADACRGLNRRVRALRGE